MVGRLPPLHRIRSGPGSHPFPRLAQLGLLAMLFGFVFDLVEHTLVSHVDETRIASFPVSEHAAHLVVIVGMVLVLVGIVTDGRRASGRGNRQQRSDFDALR